MKSYKPITIIFLFLIVSVFSHNFAVAQKFTITGKITDAETGEGIPFVNVYLPINQVGTTTDFDGYFTINTQQLEDSLVASNIGYFKRSKALDKSLPSQVINFQLDPENKKLDEVVIEAGENPAWPIMRNVLDNKEKNDKRNLEQYEYESYSKTELDIDNISEKFGERKSIQKVMAAIDTIGSITGEDGKKLIPIFMSESISKFYYKKNPEKLKENTLKNKVVGVGVKDDGVVSQIIGSSFQDYNFYKNWIRIVQKDFVSPLADGWKFYYDYYLTDSLSVGGRWCYQIEIEPKRPQDLAFKGIMWIDSETFALKQIDVMIDKTANLNYIDKIKIQQENLPTDKGNWLTYKNRVLIDIAEISKNSAGIIAKFYVSNKDFDVNTAHELKFYDERLSKEEDANVFDKDFWETNRHDSLTITEKQTYEMIDSIKNVPMIKSYVEIIEVLASGYKDIGKIDVGNYLYTYAWNNVEGHRFRLGFRTNEKFSKRLIFNGYLAYGTMDKQFKYGAGFRFILDRKPWTEFGFQRKQDIAMIAINQDDYDLPILFSAAMYVYKVKERFPYLRRENFFYIQRAFFKSITQTVEFKNINFESIDTITRFHYYENPRSIIDSPIKSNFINSELTFETRWARKETYLQNGNRRVSLGTKYPVVTFRYSLGLSNVFGSNFNYHKFFLNVNQNVRLGNWGTGNYSISAGYTPSQLPYPLLYVHLGNRTFFNNRASFNLLNYLEFLSDAYVWVGYEHNFQGLFFNRIPLLKKLKWREFISVDALLGGLRDENKNIIPLADQPNAFQFANTISNSPYVEVNYGVENIFKFLRVHFVHRLTNLDMPNARPFMIKVSAKFRL